MFTGIIEELGTVKKVEKDKDNIHLTIDASFTPELKIDQSIAHNGVCLTVISIKNNEYSVIAIKETLEKSNLDNLSPGDKINLERCMKIGGRLDGHIVQGHVDQIGTCTSVEEMDGSFVINFTHELSNNMTVEKGSICINGISLTVFNSQDSSFSVAIIPYTYENTNFHALSVGDLVNIEYDMIGKYLNRFKTLNN